EIRDRARQLRIVDGSGFSLDPTYDFDGLKLSVSDLLAQIKQRIADSAAQGPARTQEDPVSTIARLQQLALQLTDAARAFDDQDIIPWLKMIKGLKEAGSSLAKVLEARSDAYRFQAARYDGMLQGTEAGMVLFYTDLLAKIWSMNYLDSAPVDAIEEF